MPPNSRRKRSGPNQLNIDLEVGANIESDARSIGMQLKKVAVINLIGLITKHTDCHVKFKLYRIIIFHY